MADPTEAVSGLIERIDGEPNLSPCPWCRAKMMFRKALWPSDGCTDAIIHAAPTTCGMQVFDTGTTDESVIAAWNDLPRKATSKHVLAAVRKVIMSALAESDRTGRPHESIASEAMEHIWGLLDRLPNTPPTPSIKGGDRG